MATATPQRPAQQRPPAQQQARPQAPAVDLDTPLLDSILEQTVTKLDGAAARYRGQVEEIPPEEAMRRAAVQAAAMQRLMAAIEPLQPLLMGLVDSPLGFMTDQAPGNRGNKPQYEWAVVKRCAVEAVLRGFWWTGNEWNIIAGRFYGAKNGWERLVRTLPGLTDLDVSPGVPTVNGNLTCVRVRASWMLDGKRQELLGSDGKPGRTFAIIVYQTSTPDNIVGKALAKAYRAIYQKATATQCTLAAEAAEAPEEAPIAGAPADTTATEAALELERSNLVDDLGNRIREAETGAALDALAAEVGRHAAFLGDEMARAMVEEIAERGRQVSG